MQAFALFGLAVTVDLALIAADVLRHHGALGDARFAITTDRGFGELFQYAKTLFIAGLLLGVAPRSGGTIFWGGLFLLFFIDDAFGVHEAAGVRLSELVAMPAVGASLPEQVAEAVVLGIGGLAVAVVLALTLWRGGPGSRSVSLVLLPGLLLLFAFGVGVDLLHSAVRDHPISYTIGLVEDGGELVSMSLLAASAWAYARHR